MHCSHGRDTRKERQVGYTALQIHAKQIFLYLGTRSPQHTPANQSSRIVTACVLGTSVGNGRIGVSSHPLPDKLFGPIHFKCEPALPAGKRSDKFSVVPAIRFAVRAGRVGTCVEVAGVSDVDDGHSFFTSHFLSGYLQKNKAHEYETCFVIWVASVDV